MSITYAYIYALDRITVAQRSRELKNRTLGPGSLLDGYSALLD
ncbi:hypothetical protein ACFOHW_10220 [Paenibacillus abyssi]